MKLMKSCGFVVVLTFILFLQGAHGSGYVESLQRAEQGDVDAMCVVGELYIGDALFEDLGEGFKRLKKAADQKHHKSELLLSFLYLVGRGVAEDEAKWFQFVTLSADGGNDLAQAMVGVVYASDDEQNPLLPPADDVLAYKWLSLSKINQGDLGDRIFFGKDSQAILDDDAVERILKVVTARMTVAQKHKAKQMVRAWQKDL